MRRFVNISLCLHAVSRGPLSWAIIMRGFVLFIRRELWLGTNTFVKKHPIQPIISSTGRPTGLTLTKHTLPWDMPNLAAA